MTDCKCEGEYEREILVALRELAGEDHRVEVLSFLGEQWNSEQAHFWSRFAAMAALHAGLFVVAVEVHPAAGLLVACFGIALTALWSAITKKSFYYVARWKPMFHTFRQEQKLLWKGEQVNYRGRRRGSSTDLARWTVRAIFIPWILVLLWAGVRCAWECALFICDHHGH